MKNGTRKYGLTLIALGLGAGLLASSAAAGLVVVPARTENDRVLERAITPEPGQPGAERKAPAPSLEPGAGPRRDLKAERFGQTVSRQAKVFRVDPTPGYRNFGNWVSCQRRHRSDKCPPAAVPPGGTDGSPTGTPPAIPAPNAPSAPTGFAPSGGQGT